MGRDALIEVFKEWHRGTFEDGFCNDEDYAIAQAIDRLVMILERHPDEPEQPV
jgi:hypothetical protein